MREQSFESVERASTALKDIEHKISKDLISRYRTQLSIEYQLPFGDIESSFYFSFNGARVSPYIIMKRVADGYSVGLATKDPLIGG